MRDISPGRASAAHHASHAHDAAIGVPGKTTQVQLAHAGAHRHGEHAVGHAAAAAQTGAEGQAPATPPAPLAPDEIVLSRDPAQAKPHELHTLRHRLRTRLEAWGMTFDGHFVRTATDAAGAVVVALHWDPAWGARPATQDMPITLTPIYARVALTAVHQLDGWDKLDKHDQHTLNNLLGGETNQLSSEVRAHLRKKFHSLRGNPPASQARSLKRLIGDESVLPGSVNEPVEGEKTGFHLHGPTDKPNYAFQGRQADAEQWKARYDDHVTFEIVAPKSPRHGLHYHTVHQAAGAAAYLPKKARSRIETVVLNVVENPADPYWAAQYDEPNFHSYMTAGKEGIVTIFPDKKKLPDANYMRESMIHETGHTWSFKKWGEDTTKGGWLHWKHAMHKDRISVSNYATNAIAEDVAETIGVYVSTRGTPKFEEYKKMVPHRFAILHDEYR